MTRRETSEERLRDVERIQDELRPELDPLERKAVDRSRQHLAEFQHFADRTVSEVEDDQERIAKFTAWWIERGIKIDFFFVEYFGVKVLHSSTAICIEDLN